MTDDKSLISAQTRVADLLAANPALEKVLIAQSARFEKLRNPVLRQTVARVATLETAARIAGIPVDELVATLREAAGQPLDEPSAVNDSADVEEGSPVMTAAWMSRKDDFDIIDARKLAENFLPAIARKAQATEVGGGLHVVQSFEPVPLYTVLGDIGFEHETVKVSDDEYHVYFHRNRATEGAAADPSPLQPLGILKLKQVDPYIADQMVRVWERIYQREGAAIDQKTLYMLALAVGIGAGRMRQAARELVKAYASGASVVELDELFSLIIWLQGVSTFVSEISTSACFAAYERIKKMEAQGKARGEIVSVLKEEFGERHPGVGIFPDRP